MSNKEVRNLERVRRKCGAEINRLATDGWIEESVLTALAGSVKNLRRAHKKSGIDVAFFVESVKKCVNRGKALNRATGSAIRKLERLERELDREIARRQKM